MPNPETTAGTGTLTNEPDRAIADPLEAARAVSDTGKPITPDTESAKKPDTPAQDRADDRAGEGGKA